MAKASFIANVQLWRLQHIYDTQYTCRETGDRYSLIFMGPHYRCYCNEHYQTSRSTRVEAFEWIESEALMTLR